MGIIHPGQWVHRSACHFAGAADCQLTSPNLHRDRRMLTATGCPSYEFFPVSCGRHPLEERTKISRPFANSFAWEEIGDLVSPLVLA